MIRAGADVCRRSALRLAAESGGIPKWASDMRPVRGRCKGGTKRRPCRSRWAVPRVSLDFRDTSRVDRVATLECVGCGHTWRRIAAPPIRSEAGYQAALLTLIIPATANRWYSRGRWHREGDDAQVLVNADLIEANDAIRAWQGRVDKRAAAQARQRAKRAAEEAEAHERTMALLARLHEADAAREAEEAAAREREAAY